MVSCKYRRAHEHSTKDRLSWDSNALRNNFVVALSDMYQEEVPLYSTLVDIVRQVDQAKIGSGQLPRRHELERHGAIRLGTGREMNCIRRLFAVLGMHPVGYYDLSVMGLPLHATAFRPIDESCLESNPFRVFATLLRVDELPFEIRDLVETVLYQRDIFPPRLLQTLTRLEAGERLLDQDAIDLIADALEVFRWHSRSPTSLVQYKSMHSAHPIIADIVCFPSAHINHLTPRTLDIDMVQAEMIKHGLPAKARIEGPPRRNCPILLRQTSFQALQEDVEFRGPDGAFIPYTHTARFGEIEQRGAALTRKGRRLYDDLLALARQRIGDAPEGSPESETAFAEAFAGFPDTWSELRAQDLVYFKYTLVPGSEAVMAGRKAMSMADLVSQGVLSYEPITYEDFLPFSAVGIFMSNVKTESNGSSTRTHETGPGAKSSLEEVLGCRILDEFDLYRSMQRRSIDDCRRVLGLEQIVKS